MGITFVDVGGIRLLSGLASLLLVARGSGGSLLAGLLLLSRWGLASGGLAASGGLLLGSFGRHGELLGLARRRNL